MKKVFLLFALFLSVVMSANTKKPVIDGVESELRTEIIKLLKDSKFEFDNLKATVEFIINGQGELVVLNIDSKNSEVVNFIKNKLNYRFVTNKDVLIRKTYRVPLTFLKS